MNAMSSSSPSAPPDLQSFLEMNDGDTEMLKSQDVFMENDPDITDDALETMLLQEGGGQSQNRISQPSGASSSSMIGVVTSHPVQVMRQQHQQQQKQTGTLMTKLFVNKKPVNVPGQQQTQQSHQQAISFKTIPVQQKNNLTLSPVKGGFKVPISPLKNQPIKFSVVPSVSSGNIVKTLNLSNVGDKHQQHKFQFQTLVSSGQVINKRVINQPFQIQTVNMPGQQVSSVRMPCVRLIPANDQMSNHPQNFIPVQQNNGLISNGMMPKQQPFVSFQQIRPMHQQQPQQQHQHQIKPPPRLIMPAATPQQPQPPTVANLSPGTLLKSGNVGYALIPAKYVEQLKKQLNTQSMYNVDNNNVPSVTSAGEGSRNSGSQTVAINGKVHKPCNCTKSMCLKLYCECFANGHFCDGCNCINCHNNLEFDSDRSKAIRSCLDRNPYAFRPKIGRGRDDNRTHQKGCNCKRSGCLKNYCECYEARIPCTSRCKCIGCKNLEGSWPANKSQHSLMNLADAADFRCQQQAAASSRISSHIEDLRSHHARSYAAQAHAHAAASGEKQPNTFFTQEVIEATCMCMLAQAEEAEKSRHSNSVAEQMILEEFGRCMMQIIEAARKTKSSSAHA